MEYMIPVIAAMISSNLPSFNRNLMPIYIKKASTFISYDKRLNDELRNADSAGVAMSYCVAVAYMMIELCMTEIECAMAVEVAHNEVMCESMMGSIFPF